MPTYEYECQKCSHRFELFQSMKAEPVKQCPECKGAVKRLIGLGGGILFKGSGFYQTDHRSSSYKKKEESDKAPEPAKKKSSTTDTSKNKKKEK
jgi:putative FmdB family regulatory protein